METSQVFINPLDVLPIYRKLKELRAYYTLVIYNHLQMDAKRVAGYRLMNMLFDAVPLVSELQAERDKERKMEALRGLLKLIRCIIDAVEYLASLDGGRGISTNQAAHMYGICADLEIQDRRLARSIQSDGSQNPQPKGQGASSDIIEGSPSSHSEV